MNESQVSAQITDLRPLEQSISSEQLTAVNRLVQAKYYGYPSFVIDLPLPERITNNS